MRVAATVALLAALAIAGALVADADAATARKLHFTATQTSYPSPAAGQGGGEVAIILPPSDGTIYVGSVTYTASSPLRLVVLHELDGLPAGQPTWKIPGHDPYAASYLGAEATSGSFAFAGAAVILSSEGSGSFVATASVDAFARGQPAEIRVERIEIIEAEPEVRLVRAEVPVTIPLHEGVLDEERVLYAITDSSDSDLADELTDAQAWPVAHAPPLSELLWTDGTSGGHEPAKVYAFRNGVKGDGLEGYQPEVFSASPGDRAYTPASQLVYVEWKRHLNPEVLSSVEDVEQARTDGRVSLEESGIVLNLPQVSWPGGQLPLSGGGAAPPLAAEVPGDGDETPAANGEETDAGAGNKDNDRDNGNGNGDNGDSGNGGGETAEADAPGGEDTGADEPPEDAAEEPEAEVDIVVPESYQATEINAEEMTATFIARRAWGPEGQSTYHIMAGATPAGPARVTGTADARGMQNYTATDAAADLYYFRGGLLGDGALGSQPSVAGVALGSEGYTPLWRVHVIEWADESAAALVESRADIDKLVEDGTLVMSVARPLGFDLIVNAPMVDPFWTAPE